MNYKIAVLPGDGIGPEVMREGVAVLKQIAALYGFAVELEEGLVGGASIERGEDLSVARELMDLEIPVSAEQLADESVELEDLLEQEEVPV